MKSKSARRALSIATCLLIAGCSESAPPPAAIPPQAPAAKTAPVDNPAVTAAAEPRVAPITHTADAQVRLAQHNLAESRGLNDPRPLNPGEECIGGTIVAVDRAQRSAVQVLENFKAILCENTDVDTTVMRRANAEDAAAKSPTH